MMQGAGRNMQTVFLAYVQAAVITGLMLSGMPSCVADDSLAPDASPESTQIGPAQTNTSTPKAVKPVAKTFNMDMLIERLKKTNALGMFTKLALRSDALDIMDMVKAYNKQKASYSVKKLRARFDGLVLKVLALLDDDPGLSRDISLAREDIWKSLLTNKDRTRAAAFYPYSLVQEVKA